ncbi:MAG: hypothetical protein A2632_01460 [Candidatus Pacebacteria bacterium RIFCSPHIGHO2_01_FULL_46_16]|nr:MAG: hypothetical protein A2632_01460 [Candidatus Pacebacteria bacterium RIFCSPHIGHO2_01_FULL_46_16]OGJ20147.1 MAG: hypothetical protein A3J60_03925 [Candidatus Pacebacteria bacterium RIFCSPHIGHO2_02_FULL_46_9]
MQSNRILFWCSGVVLLLAIFFRFWQLGQVPHGMTWDEAAIGYNGYAVITTRRDEWLERLPISFRSFGDYKAPLAIYINGISTAVFGMTLWAVRFPFAMAGAMSIFGFGFLVYLLLPSEKRRLEWAVVGSMLLALSPWHIHFSRIGFESGMSLFFATWGWVGLLFLLQLKRVEKPIHFVLIGITTTFLAAALYTYHSPKLVVPLVTLALFVYQWKVSRFKRGLLLRSVVVSVVWLILLSPLVKDVLLGVGGARMSELVFFQPNSTTSVWVTIWQNTLVQLSPSFLLEGATTTLRHGGRFWGYLYPTTYVFALLGMTAIFYKKMRLLSLLAVALVFIGSLPAILGSEVPHSNRALFALLGYLLLAISGGRLLFQIFTQDHVRTSLIGMSILLHLLFVTSFFQQYFVIFAQASAADFQDGYLEAFEIARAYELGELGKPPVEKILFSSVYGQPYIYALFVRQTNPIWYRGGSLQLYEFSDRISTADLLRENTLIVATPDQNVPIEQATRIVIGSDGKVRFAVYVTK